MSLSGESDCTLRPQAGLCSLTAAEVALGQPSGLSARKPARLRAAATKSRKGQRPHPLRSKGWGTRKTKRQSPVHPPSNSLASGTWLTSVHALSALQQRLQPSQHSWPASVVLRDFRMGQETAVADSNQGALGLRFQFPADGGFHGARPARHPGGDQQARRIDRQIFSRDFEVVALAIQPAAAPFSSHAQVALKLGAAIDAGLAPPLDHLFGIDERLKDALRRCGDINLADNFVRVRYRFGFRDLQSSDSLFLFPSCLGAGTFLFDVRFNESFQAGEICLPKNAVTVQPAIDGPKRGGIQSVNPVPTIAVFLH